MRIWRWGRKWPHHHRFVWLFVCVFVCASRAVQITPLITTVPSHCKRNKLFPLSPRRKKAPLYSTITSEHWKKQAVLNDLPKDCWKRVRREKRGKRWLGGWVCWLVVVGFRGCQAKNKTGDEERKWKEMSAKIVMRRHNHTGWDEKGELEQRRIEKRHR